MRNLRKYAFRVRFHAVPQIAEIVIIADSYASACNLLPACITCGQVVRDAHGWPVYEDRGPYMGGCKNDD